MLQTSLVLSYPDLPIINLTPGKLLITDQPAIVSTILGSCVSLCLHNERLRVGAICHGMLPRQTKTPMAGYFPYLDTAVDHMLETLRSRFGIAPSELRVKLFGGASVLQTNMLGADGFAIGQQNIAAALTPLPAGLTVQPGTEANIFFNTSTGEVFCGIPHPCERLARIMKLKSALTLNLAGQHDRQS
jgi:chemotaxis protein CheD